jgi:uncharacterized membrane protein YjgN (DUF898 family)
MKKKLIITIGIIILSTIVLSAIASAYYIPDEYRPENQPFGFDYSEKNLQEGAGATTAIIILQIIAGGLLYFAVPVAVILIANAAMQMVTGGADTEKLEQSKKNLTWLIIGLLVIIFSYSIVRFVIGMAIKSADQEALPSPTTTEEGGE